MTINRVKLLNYFRTRDRGWVLSLILLVILLYVPFLGSPFFFDDLTFFFGGIAQHYAHSWFHFDLRWLPNASLGWTEAVFSNAATQVYRLENLLIHAANTVLLFYLLRKLMTAATGNGENAGAIAWGAWFGALFFALHPVAVYAAGYVVQRSILMATFFALTTQLAYLHGLLGGRVRWFAVAAVCYFLAVFSKEHSVLTIAVLAVETALLRPRIAVARWPLALTWGALLGIAVLIILRAKGVFGLPYEPLATQMFKHEGVSVASTQSLHIFSVLTQAGLFFKYLLLWLVPNPGWMSIDMREPFIATLGNWKGWVGAGAFLLYGGIALRLLLSGGRRGALGLALLYPWLQFILEFSTIRVQEPFVLYRSYLWMPGLALLVPLLLQRWPSARLRYALAVVTVALAALAVNQLWIFADGYRMWKQAEQALPNDRIAGADRIFFNLAQAEEGRGMVAAAITDFKHSVALSPQYAPPHFELGWIYLRTGKMEDAMKQFDRALAIDPKMGRAYFGKAMVLRREHRDAEAAAMMEKACKLKSDIACLIATGKVER